MRLYNLVFSFVLIGISLMTMVWSRDFPGGFRGSGLSPKFFPQLIVIFILFLTTFVLIGTIRDTKRESIDFTINKLTLPLILIAMITVYVILIQPLGILIDTIVFLFLSMIILKTNKKIALLLSVFVTAIVYLIFKLILHIPLPQGMLFGG